MDIYKECPTLENGNYKIRLIEVMIQMIYYAYIVISRRYHFLIVITVMEAIFIVPKKKIWIIL